MSFESYIAGTDAQESSGAQWNIAADFFMGLKEPLEKTAAAHTAIARINPGPSQGMAKLAKKALLSRLARGVGDAAMASMQPTLLQKIVSSPARLRAAVNRAGDSGLRGIALKSGMVPTKTKLRWAAEADPLSARSFGIRAALGASEKFDARTLGKMIHGAKRDPRGPMAGINAALPKGQSVKGLSKKQLAKLQASMAAKAAAKKAAKKKKLVRGAAIGGGGLAAILGAKALAKKKDRE